MERQCRKFDLPWVQPTAFPRSALLPLRVALVGAEQPWMGAFCRGVMALNFAEDREIDAPDVVAEVLEQLGLSARPILDEAQSESNKLKLRQQTEAAQARGVFGAPTFFVGDEMFWGNDRLDDALACCAQANR
jgi:2-hydroxychromene-2-carboxylate isomerase